MTLRHKILMSFIMLSLINSLICLFVLETAYLNDMEFTFGKSPLLAPGLLHVSVWMILGTLFISWLLFLTIRRLVLDPLHDISSAAERLASGDVQVHIPAGRADELGRLAATFNSMAHKIYTNRQTLEEKIKEATICIEKTQQDLAFAERLAATGRLAAGVAHEINNPLGGVMNAVARLRNPEISTSRKEKYLNICDDGLKRIQETVRRILDFARKRPSITTVPVAIPLKQSIELIRHRLDEACIALHLNLGTDNQQRSVRVKADSGDLQHVFLNILINAIDAMPQGGDLTVNLSTAFSWAIVEIIDTGIGMTPQEVSESFEYFHTTKPVGKGTGLGLSIAHHIINGYKGSLTLNSEKGIGTRAVIELPLTDERPETPGRGISAEERDLV